MNLRGVHHQRFGHEPRRTALCQAKAKATSRQTPIATGATRETPLHVVDDDDQRIDAGRRVECSGQVHDDDREPDRGSRRPGPCPGRMEHQEPNRHREKVTTHEGARLGRRGLRRSHHKDDRGRKRNEQQRKVVRSARSSITPIATAPPAAPAMKPSTSPECVVNEGSCTIGGLCGSLSPRCSISGPKANGRHALRAAARRKGWEAQLTSGCPRSCRRQASPPPSSRTSWTPSRRDCLWKSPQC